MSLFDFVYRDQSSEAKESYNQTSQNRQQQTSTKAIRPVLTSKGRSKPKPEKLKFLKPCPICQGKAFVHGRNGGFFCSACQPGIKGHPVIARGHRKPPATAEGLPCAGCGSTTYTKEQDAFIFDDGTLADGWHCGGKNCRVKLVIGNKEADQGSKGRPAADTGQHRPERKKHTSGPDQHFKAAFPWIREHLPELLAAGWTRPALFRRGNCAWPAGNWGLAWLPVWNRIGLDVSIGEQGQLNFTFPSNGRQIKQAATVNE